MGASAQDGMRCTLRRFFLVILFTIFLIFLGFFIFFLYLIMTDSDLFSKDPKLEYCIQTQWDGRAIDHSPICIELSSNSTSSVQMMVTGPYFADPIPPKKDEGPYPGLYDYEVAEAFFLNKKSQQYLEVELSPQGYHLVLMLNGYRNTFKQELPLTYSAEIKGNQWTGVASIPADYFPPEVDAFNAYAIHGSGVNRVYEAMYPVEQNQFSSPDFHRLDFFKPIEFKKLLESNANEDYKSSYWQL